MSSASQPVERVPMSLALTDEVGALAKPIGLAAAAASVLGGRCLRSGTVSSS